ncbi:hypothetical protein ACIXCV_22585, partial [Bacteroides fragilis]
ITRKAVHGMADNFAIVRVRFCHRFANLEHKNITTTQIYSKMAAQQMCEVVDKITLKRREA